MEKRRIRLEINGVVCGLITQESEEYMEALAREVGGLIQSIQEASPYITREAAALTAALGYCDDAGKNEKRMKELQERIDELEVEAEIWQEEKAEMEKKGASAEADPALLEKLQKLEQENTALTEASREAQEWKERAQRLEDENTALRENSAAASDTVSADELSDARDKLSRTQELNRLLEEELKAKDEQVQKAEQEKTGAISAARRAVEEAKRRVDELQAEAAGAKRELERVKKENASPALDILEQEVKENIGADAVRNSSRSRRKNPLRYEEDFEGEGFVSFFEKK